MRLDPAHFRIDGDGTATDEAIQPTVPRRETMMNRAEIEELKVAVQDCIGLGAPPEAMQPINDFINKEAEEAGMTGQFGNVVGGPATAQPAAAPTKNADTTGGAAAKPIA